jgi:hypothetical protein
MYSMTYRECIWVEHEVDVSQYLAILTTEYGAIRNKDAAGSYLIGDPPVPFYEPQLIDGRTAITGFNRIPLSPLLLEALVRHPELAPPDTTVLWTEEQDLVTEGNLEGYQPLFGGKER